MSQPYVGEIRMFGGNFAPAGWMFCAGQLLPISENDTLFNLIGTTYGGDGQETFALPNLQSRVPIHAGTAPNGTTYQLAEMAGTETVTLSVQQLPAHTHAMIASLDVGGSTSPANNILAQSPNIKAYFEAVPNQSLAATAVSPVGGSQPHENLQPYLSVNFIISLFGIYPSQT